MLGKASPGPKYIRIEYINTSDAFSLHSSRGKYMINKML